ncbi:MAG: diguanylate cyclase [Bryobacteraceae bacterium]
MRFFSAFLPLGLLFAGLAVSAGPEPDGGLTVLTHAQDIRNLSPDEAKRGYPVHLRVVVTFVDMAPGEAFVQDETAGVFVFVRESVSDAPLHVGQAVDLTGITTPGNFSPCITKAHLKVLGAGALPEPKRRPFEELVGGKQDGQWFELEGVVRSGQTKGGRLLLDVAAVGGSFVAVMPEFRPDWARKLVDARVVMLGALAAIFNERRQSAGVRLFVPGSEFVRIKDAAPPDVFRLPETTAGSVGQFRPMDGLPRRIRVRATVTAMDPGMAAYVADSTGNLEVQANPGCAAQPGDLVDVAGFPGVIEGRLGLQDSLCRKVGRGVPIPIVPVQAKQVIPSQVRTDSSGYGFAAGMRYDGRLISLEATLLETSYNQEAGTLLLRSPELDFTATLPTFAGRRLPQLEPGSRLRLAGICLVTYDPYHRAQFFRILLRSPDDIAILAWPSWWTLKHSVWTLCLLAVFFLAASAWIYVLRHQVSMQTRQLRLVNERLTELSTRDPLTHAFNRRQFDKVLESEMQRGVRSGLPLSLVMVDIDHFKSLNDVYGHQKGDDCLIQVVRALQATVHRSGDLVARYGGEEFVAILPETDREGALQIAESMRAAVASLAIPHPVSRIAAFVTISAGVTTSEPTAEASAVRIIDTADRALYEAKRLGRNRVIHMETAVTRTPALTL